MSGRNLKIALVSMPFYPVDLPSIQIGLLKSTLSKQGYLADDFYFNIDFAQIVGFNFYDKISKKSELMIGDWLFSQAAHDLDIGDMYFDTNEELFRKLLQDTKMDFRSFKIRLSEIKKDKIFSWLEKTLSSSNYDQYDVVGFSCTYAQTNASLALAKLIKRKYPNKKIIFGGSAFEGVTGEELSKNVDYVDCVVSGEGENAIIEVIDILSKNKCLPKLFSSKQPVDIGLAQVPDYTNYFSRIENEDDLLEICGLEGFGQIPIETSRGCWWGEKQHCTFCGLNGLTMNFRSKSAIDAIHDLAEMSDKYDSYNFFAVDNIMDFQYFESLLPLLKEKGTSYRFFYEIKSNLSQKQIELLYAAGVRSLQPGIESLSTKVLTLMKKGCSATQNLELLKWGKHYGLNLAWNLLYGFPGESEADYLDIIDLVPKIVHYQPPAHIGEVSLTRFSPYYNDYLKDREHSPFKDVRPAKVYESVYPSDWNLWNMAYYFDSKIEKSLSESVVVKLKSLITDWQDKHANKKRPDLTFRKSTDFGHVLDTRGEEEKVFKIKGDHFLTAVVLESKARTFESLREELNLQPECLQSVLNDFIEMGLGVKIDQMYFWLAMPEK